MTGPKWRLFTLKDKSTVHVGKLPLGGNEGHTWVIQYEAGTTPRRGHFGRDEGISAGGRSLRKSFAELRLRISFYMNPESKKVHDKIRGVNRRINFYSDNL